MKITLKSVLVVAMLLLIATCKKDEKTVTVFEVIDLQVSDNSVRINGKITSLSGNNITDYGICYSVKNNSPVATDTALHLGVPEVGAFSATINNLQRNKTYYFRGFIREAGQYLYDDVRSAKIEAVAPSAITAAAGSIAESSAVLNGSVNANGVSTTVSFEYGTTTAYGNVINAAPNPLTGTSASNVSANLAGLASNTTYHYRVRAVNAAGTVTGEDVSFTTTINLVAPAATTTAASSVTNTTATINGSVNANGSNTTISFEYGNSFLYGSVISASPSTASSIVPVSVSASLTGLTPGQLYHFRVKAVSAGGTTNGEDFTFTTTQPPAATTNDASNTGANSATLNGAVNAFGISANIYFEYGTTASYGTIAAADPSSSSASSSVASKLDLTGLAENTTYHFRIKAVSAGGTSYGTDHVFTTSVSASLPVMYTELVTDITQTAASCGGTVTSDGGGAIIAAGVCWSTTSPPLVSGNKTTDPVSSGTFTSNITGLTAGTTYYIRSYATNSAGTGYGPERSFSTATAIAIPTITTSAVTDITQTSAVSGGNISSDGGDAITASGVCWNTSANPTISNNKTLDGSTIGAFISNITGLTPGVTYYVRSYATNSAGTAYGSQVSFATQAASIDLPTLSTAAITSITQTSASSGGNVISQGGAAVTARGVCWNTSPDPTISNSKTSDGNGTGSFTSSLTSLSASTTYYVRAYATNASGTAYGNTQTFTTNSVVTQSASTSAASSITQTTATFNGTVNANGLSVTVTFEYGLTTSYGSNITASGSPVSGSITTAVTANVTGLSANTQYNYRIKTVSSSGTVYGDNQTFSTLAGVLPTVTTVSPVTGITTSGASGGGNVTVQGSSAVTARGVCWSTGLNPTTANSKTTNGTGTGAFTSSITGLIANTLYHVRAYATNSTGTAYGDDVTFTTSAVVVAPTVTTASVSPGITTASTGGNVTLDGGASVTARGVCYGTSASPDITGLKTTDGTGTGSFTSNLAGLTGSTTYHVRAYATNSAGTAYGNDIQFTTNAAAVVPTVSTADISAITTSSASSGGNVTFDGNATVTARGICWGTSVNPTTSNSTFPNGSGTGTFTGDMTALSPGTTYHVRAYATNSAGTGYGNDISFATLCIQPSASTSVATGVTATTATLNGNINANNFSTNVTFDYGLTTGYGTTVAGSPASVTGSAGTAVTASISGLLPNTLYHFRVNGANCAGTVNGSDLTFTTPCTTATATVNTPTGVAATSATLRGSVNANNVSTTVLFEYGIDTNYGSSVAASPVTVTGSSVTPVTAVISGLTPNATYHYRVKTATCGGASYSSDQAFSTICAAPTASTAAATAIGISGATFNGSVNPNYGNATVTFDYGTTTSYGLSATAAQSPVTGNTPTAVSATVTTLAQGTTYHYRTRVVTCYGTPILGSDQVFQTLCNAPTATTSPANVTDPVAGRAVLYGVVNGGGNSTTVQFEYGTSTAYGTTVYGSPSSVSGSSNTAVSATITGLTEGTVYYFRVKATSCYGTVYGASERFVLDINGNLYHIVSYLVRSKLGGYITYTWMKENLRATSYSDLTPVPPGCDTCTMYSISYKPYGGISSNADVYGMLYNGVTVNSPKNICPTGWHVPTYSEWTSLINYAGTTTAAGKLKEVGNVHWYSPNTGAEDFIGFSARGGGYATSSASYGLNTYGYWWADGTLQYIRLIYNDATVVSNTVSEDYYFSIRCKK